MAQTIERTAPMTARERELRIECAAAYRLVDDQLLKTGDPERWKQILAGFQARKDSREEQMVLGVLLSWFDHRAWTDDEKQSRSAGQIVGLRA